MTQKPARERQRIFPILLVLAAPLVSASVAYAGDELPPSPKPRSSSPQGVVATIVPEAGSSAPAAARLRLPPPPSSPPASGDGNTASRPAGRPVPATPTPSGSAPAPSEGVRIYGNAHVDAVGRDVSTSTTGDGNSGCTNIGSIAGSGC